MLRAVLEGNRQQKDGWERIVPAIGKVYVSLSRYSVVKHIAQDVQNVEYSSFQAGLLVGIGLASNQGNGVFGEGG